MITYQFVETYPASNCSASQKEVADASELLSENVRLYILYLSGATVCSISLVST